MDQLIIIGLIVVFSILNEIAKKKTKEAEAELQGQGPHELTPEELDWQFDPVAEAGPRPEEGRGLPDRPGPSSPPDGDAQPVIPRNVWEEIAALASGQPLPAPSPKPPAPVPARARTPRPPLPVEVEDRRRERGPPRPDHEIHRAHAKYGTPVSERLRPLDTPAMHRSPSKEVRDVMALLSGGGESLRQAIILQEVLGRPVSLRDE